MGNKVLIVEDDSAIREAFKLVLAKAGFDVIVSSDGAQLLNGPIPTADLIILDKQLSGVDGLDICRHLKGKPDTRHIHILMTSATPHVARLAANVQADGFIEKPFNNREVVEMVKRYLS